jgi:hypothetical protein
VLSLETGVKETQEEMRSETQTISDLRREKGLAEETERELNK